MSDYSVKDHIAYKMGFKAGQESQADRIAELEEELSIWRSVFPDIAPERVLPDRSLHLARIAELEAALATAQNDALEKAAKISDSCAADWAKSAKGKYLETKWDYESRADAGEEIAAAIRAAVGEGKP